MTTQMITRNTHLTGPITYSSPTGWELLAGLLNEYERAA